MFSQTKHFANAEQLKSQFHQQFENQLHLLQSAASKAFEGAEKVLELSLNLSHDQLAHSRAVAQKLISAKNPQDFLAQSSELFKPSIDSVSAYGSKLIHIANETQAQLLRMATEKFKQSEQELSKYASQAEQKMAKAVNEVVAAVEEVAEDLLPNKSAAEPLASAKPAARSEEKPVATKATTKVTTKASAKTTAKASTKATTTKADEKPTAKASSASPASVAKKANFPAKLPAAPSVKTKPSAAKPAKAVKVSKPVENVAAAVAAPVVAAPAVVTPVLAAEVAAPANLVAAEVAAAPISAASATVTSQPQE